MKIVLLTGHSPEGDVQHRYVATRLAEAFPDALKAIVVAVGRPRPLAEKLRRHWKRYSVRQLVSRFALRLSDRLRGSQDARRATFARILFPGGDSGAMPRRDLLREIPSHNGLECLAILDAIRPDVIVVYGTLVIGRKLIAAAPGRIVNMHTGLSPRYRGSDTIFWPLHEGEPEWVGVTIHRLDAGLDSGPILKTGQPAIAADDDEHSLFAKAVQVGTGLLIEAVREEAAGTSVPLVQDLASGREFRSVQRTVAAEAKVRRALRAGLLRDHAARHG